MSDVSGVTPSNRPPSSRGLRGWLDERMGLADLIQQAREKQVPIHRHSIWYYLGGMTLFLFGIQVATGILLLLYYRPSADEAYESVQFLMTEVQFGWLVRSIHAWSANLMILTLFLHAFSVLLVKAYRPPREVTWLSGMALFGLALAFGFTGYLLPWNTLALFATKVGTDIPGELPLVGDFVRRLLRGGPDVTGATLTRFYGIHVAILPALTTAFLGMHLYLVQRHGMSVPPGVEGTGGSARAMPFLPNFLLRDIIGWLTALGALATLAAFFPTELGEKADPFLPAPAGIRPEWYFVFMFQTLKYLPAHVLGLEGELLGVLAFGLIGLLLLLVPFVDRGAGRARLVTLGGLLLIGYILTLTVLGYVANPTQ
jgi:quinol-cytochrome oxidoreductase complex cytochrome b subunit